MDVAAAAMAEGYDVVIGYGELGGADLSYWIRKGLRLDIYPCNVEGLIHLMN